MARKKKNQPLSEVDLSRISGGGLMAEHSTHMSFPQELARAPSAPVEHSLTQKVAPSSVDIADTFSAAQSHSIHLVPESPDSPSRIKDIKDAHYQQAKEIELQLDRLNSQDSNLTRFITDLTTELKSAPAKTKSDLGRQLAVAKKTQDEVRARITNLNDEMAFIGKNASAALNDAMATSVQTKTSRPVQAGSEKSKGPSSAEFLSTALGTPIDQDRTHAIPEQIHRFWSGGKMSDAAMKTLEESLAKTQGTKWQHTLWYSRELEAQLDKQNLVSKPAQKEREEQRNRLKLLGYKVKAIEDLKKSSGVSPSDMKAMATKAAKQVADGGSTKYDGIKHLSDIARLMYLNGEGGHHFDVDMGLGDMDFSRSYYHNDADGKVPLFGAVTAVTRDPIAKELAQVKPSPSKTLSDITTAEAATKVAKQASDMSVMLNGMIATRPNNPRLESAIQALREDAVNPSSDFSSGMTVNKQLLYGEEGGASLDQAAKEKARAQSVPAYLLDLEHLTEESDNR